MLVGEWNRRNNTVFILTIFDNVVQTHREVAGKVAQCVWSERNTVLQFPKTKYHRVGLAGNKIISM